MMHNIFSNNYLRRVIFFGLILLIIVAGSWFPANETKAAAGVSKILSYQGRLTDQNGAALTGTYYICFSIYDAPSAGTKLWPTGVPTNNSVTVTDGVFNVGIGVSDVLGFDFSSNNTVYLNIGVWSANVACDNASVENLAPRQRIDATAYARVAENVYGGEVRVGVGAGVSAGSQKYLKLDVVTNGAEALGIPGSCTGSSMWFNTGNNAPLICTANAIQQVLTTANVVTAAQGGTGQSSYAIGDLLYASGATTLSKLPDVTAGSYLRSGGAGTAPAWSTATLPNTVAAGDLLYANATNVISALGKGTANQVLSMDGTGTNVLWAAPAGGSPGAPVNSIQFNNASSFGGSADFAWDNTNKTFILGGVDTEMQLKAITTEPTPPAVGSNNIYIYAKSIAGRIMPKWVGPSGVDVPFQAFVGQDKIAWWNPPGNSTTVPGVLGFTAPTALGTATARNVATTNLFTRTRRLGYVSAATNPSYAGHYNVAAGTQYTIGNGTGLGGFFYVVRFGTSDAATVSTAKMFVGMTSTTAAPGTTDPSTFTNSIGVGHSATDANLKLFYGGSAAQTPIDFGANFPKNTLSVDMYELILFATPTYTGNPTVGYKVTRLNTNNVAEGTLTGVAGTVLPASTTLLGHRAYRLNNAASAVGLDIASIYISSDY